MPPVSRELVGGPYAAPPWRLGEIVPCLYRDHDVVVVGVSDALIPWPLGERARLEKNKARHRGLIVGGDLARAVATEAAVTVAHWWGVSHKTAARWRVALLGRPDGLHMTEGTKALFSSHGKEVVRSTQGPHSRAKQADTLKAWWQGNRPAWCWTPEEDAAILAAGKGQMEAVAQTLGKTLAACYVRKCRLLKCAAAKEAMTDD